jgi:hypothetical protein
LRLAGGTPTPARTLPARTIERPQAMSPDFTYHPPGRLLPGTGLKGHDGVADYTVYADIRFPLAQAPAYANSQSFMHWGDCDHTGRIGRSGRKDGVYRCRVNGLPLTFNEGAAENYSYPWRDNFCEHRYFYVGQCGAGQGHQGQDIRPRSCKQRNEGADRCEPYRDELVAVRDGMVMRAVAGESLFLVVNSETELMRYRYMHMHPDHLDAAGLVNGRVLREGEPLAGLGNYNRRNNGTTNHLHFEMQVATRQGWVRVNPYATLIAAYERLIGGRGRPVSDADTQREAATEKTTSPR